MEGTDIQQRQTSSTNNLTNLQTLPMDDTLHYDMLCTVIFFIAFITICKAFIRSEAPTDQGRLTAESRPTAHFANDLRLERNYSPSRNVSHRHKTKKKYHTNTRPQSSATTNVDDELTHLLSLYHDELYSSPTARPHQQKITRLYRILDHLNLQRDTHDFFVRLAQNPGSLSNFSAELKGSFLRIIKCILKELLLEAEFGNDVDKVQEEEEEVRSSNERGHAAVSRVPESPGEEEWYWSGEEYHYVLRRRGIRGRDGKPTGY